jgi:hypothetical protein
MKDCPHPEALPEEEGDEGRPQRVLTQWEVAAMKSRFAWVLLIGLGLVGTAAGEASRIELRDGSIISGEVVGFADGRYLVQSPALGRVTIDQSQIRSLQPGGTAGGDAGGYGAQITDLQQQILGDVEIMAMITSLQSDPRVQAALADPEFMHLVASGNLGALQSNPRFKALMNSPGLRTLQERMTGH